MNERRDKTRRMQFFFCAIELLKIETIHTEKILYGKRCFEFLGVSSDVQEFGVHIREEVV